MVPRLLSDYPWVVVNLSCKLCGRRGRYRLVRLAARYGPDMPLDRLLSDLACDCPYWRSNPRKYDPRCGARFEDLDRLPPRDVPTVEPVVRQRPPAREDLPQRRVVAVLGPPGQPAMLSGWTAPNVVVACKTCGRSDVYETAALKAATVGDVRLVDLRRSLVGGCPRIKAVTIAEGCGARLDAEG